MWSGVSAEDLACHVRMVSSTCSVESAWLASFFSDLRLHSFRASKLAASRILESDCGEDEEETVRTQPWVGAEPRLSHQGRIWMDQRQLRKCLLVPFLSWGHRLLRRAKGTAWGADGAAPPGFWHVPGLHKGELICG